jgi:pyridoxal 5'-phosphate synthase pdxT subunit
VLVGVLALQGDFAEHRAALSEIGADSRPVRRPADLSDIDGLILPGGESTTMSMLLDSSGLAEPIGREVAAGLPAFGTCAGMIMLAREVVDGRSDQRSYGVIDLVVRRNGYGRQLDSFECDLVIPVIGSRPLHAVFIRAPMVESAGLGVEVLSSLAGPDITLDRGVGEAQVAPAAGTDRFARDETSRSGTWAPSHRTPVVCRQSNVLVAAFHPELTSDRRLHELFLSSIGGGAGAGTWCGSHTASSSDGVDGARRSDGTSAGSSGVVDNAGTDGIEGTYGTVTGGSVPARNTVSVSFRTGRERTSIKRGSQSSRVSIAGGGPVSPFGGPAPTASTRRINA